MGAGGKSWLGKHLEEIVEAFIIYFGRLDSVEVGGASDEIIENPAPYLWSVYHQMERWDKLPWDGGLLDQPYLLMLELEALDRAIQVRRKQIEQRLAQQAANDAALKAQAQAMEMQRQM